MAQTVKCLSTMWETKVQSLGGEDPLEKEMAAHSSTLAWKTPWTEEPGGLQSMQSQRVRHDWAIPPCGFSSSHVWMWDLDHKEAWARKDWCFWTGLGEDSWESFGQQGNQSILKKINPEYSLEGLMLNLQYFGHQLIRKDPDAGKDWRQEEKGTTGQDGWIASPTQWV